MRDTISHHRIFARNGVILPGDLLRDNYPEKPVTDLASDAVALNRKGNLMKRQWTAIGLALTLAFIAGADAKDKKVTWQTSWISPSIEWELKATGENVGKHIAKLVVTKPDDSKYQVEMVGEKDDWRIQFPDSMGIRTRGCFLGFNADRMYKTKAFSYEIFLDGQPVTAGKFEEEDKFSYGKEAQRKSFKFFPLPASKLSGWTVSQPYISMGQMTCRDKFQTGPKFTATFKFTAPDKTFYSAVRSSNSSGSTDSAPVNFPRDFSPKFAGYKAGKYVWTTTANSTQVDSNYFNVVIDKSNPPQITVLTPPP